MKNFDLTFENYSSEINNSLKNIDNKKIDLFASKLQKALQESNKIIICRFKFKIFGFFTKITYWCFCKGHDKIIYKLCFMIWKTKNRKILVKIGSHLTQL